MAVCRPGCGACCSVISISSPLPGMPGGKPAGIRCVNLDDEDRCRIHGRADYPAVCAAFTPSAETCGSSSADAADYLGRLERATTPD